MYASLTFTKTIFHNLNAQTEHICIVFLVLKLETTARTCWMLLTFQVGYTTLEAEALASEKLLYEYSVWFSQVGGVGFTKLEATAIPSWWLY